MKIDVDRFRESTCIKCKKHNKNRVNIRFGQCIADNGDVYRCARQKIFEFNASGGKGGGRNGRN